MGLVVLLRGEPGNGKSFGSLVMKALDRFDAVLHTDELYVGYIYTQQRHLYQDNLRNTILSHYLHHRGAVGADWERFLFEVVTTDAAKVGRLLVEGWQLTFCFERLGRALAEANHGVRQVLAAGRKYYPEPPPPLTIEQLAEWVRP